MLVNKKCIGCGACKLICPKKCISIVQNEQGFFQAVIDKERCINCNLCSKVCQFNNDLKLHKNIKIYAVKNKDDNVRQTSSSGGVFSSLNKYFINDGFVVGAIFDDELLVSHKITNKDEDSDKFKGSKYMQSNLKNIFFEVKEELLNGEKVLFSGTPCQCNALLNYLNFLKIDVKNLFICDVICHGVPSQLNFAKYKKYLEEKYDDDIIKINFRFKDACNIQNIKIDLKNNIYKNTPRNDPYYYSFLKGYGLMNNCYKCNFSKFERCTDLTIGDYWGIQDFHKNFYDMLGVSLVIINTRKGMEIFNIIKDEFNYIEITKSECQQPSLLAPVVEPDDNKIFNNLISKFEYTEIQKFLGVKNEKNKI